MPSLRKLPTNLGLLFYVAPCIYSVLCYIAMAFIDAAEVSKCYSMNNDNYCFYTSDSSGSLSSWNEAREFCAAMNSTLPIITDENIDNVFQQFIVNDANSVTQHRSVWLDAYARHVNNSVRWHWINGQPSGTDDTVVNFGCGAFLYSCAAGKTSRASLTQVDCDFPWLLCISCSRLQHIKINVHCVSKNVLPLICYNFDIRECILIFWQKCYR